jgi:hypothetical protein
MLAASMAATDKTKRFTSPPLKGEMPCGRRQTSIQTSHQGKTLTLIGLHNGAEPSAGRRAFQIVAANAKTEIAGTGRR